MPHILIVEDETIIRSALRRLLERNQYQVSEAGSVQEAQERFTIPTFDLIVSDLRLPGAPGTELIKLGEGTPVLIMTSYASLRSAVDSMKMGAVDYIAKPFDHDEMLQAVARILRDRQSAPAAGAVVASKSTNGSGKSAVDNSNGEIGIIGSCPPMQDLYSKIRKVAPTDSNVLIQGESGTGKELVARALHDYGKRRNGPFVAINMAAIPRDLIESELFGHEKGAFTGAQNRSTGRFEQAEGGTLFLDEIGDMPMDAQTRLLRVLQQGEYTTVGGRTPIRTDVRIVAATNKDLKQSINQGLFREDLYYRLNVVPLRLPPLRDRAEDIPDLVRHFIQQGEKEGLEGKRFESEALEVMKAYAWPGNVRELENLIRRLMALYPQEVITREIIEQELQSDVPDSPLDKMAVRTGSLTISQAVEENMRDYFASFGDGLPPPGLYDRVLRELEYPLILAALTATRGNQIKAADLLGLNRNTLRKKIRELGVSVYRSSRPS